MFDRSERSARILIVDDEGAVRDILSDGLEDAGFETTQAASAARALQLVQSERFDLVLSDVDMPETDGLELLKLVRAFDPDLDVVMVTGMVDTRVAIGAIRDGAADYVTKPFNLEEVAIVVERTLEKRRLILENRAYQSDLEFQVEARTAELRAKKLEVERLYGELEASYESTLRALVTALDVRDHETQGHSLRVVEYAMTVSRELNVDAETLNIVRRGALLHDVGKIGISDSILRKPGPLNEDEWAEMKRHPELGFRMLSGIGFLEPALDIVLCHQERWDGSGYPRGLRGADIPLGARIFAVVDTFDAMTSDRPYRDALTIERAAAEVARCSGTQFDPEIAEAFLSIPIDTWRAIREHVHEQVVEGPASRAG